MWTRQNHYLYTGQLLFGTLHSTQVLYNFCKTTIILLWNYYFGNRKELLDHIQTKKYFGVVTTRVFSQCFYSLMKPFSLNSLEQRDTDSLFATIPLWYSLFGMGCANGVECLCTQFVKCNTGVILSQSTRLCASYVLPVGWLCWPHSTRWMQNRTVPMVDTSLQWAGVCLRGSWFFWIRLWWHPSLLLGFQLWGILSVSH